MIDAHPALMLACDEQGADARAAYAVYRADYRADTPQRRWAAASPAKGRQSIYRLLGLEGNPLAGYAAHPFRVLDTDDGPRIAAAIGVDPIFDNDRSSAWSHLDIRDVLLWEPRTNAVEIAGEHRTASRMIAPDGVGDALTVYADARAFFRDWAAERVRIHAIALRQPLAEPRDGGLPGALIVGAIDRAPIRDVACSRMIAGPGLKRNELQRAVIAAANLPKIEGAHVSRG